jgi:PPOX class probable F420-dependent enzyme
MKTAGKAARRAAGTMEEAAFAERSAGRPAATWVFPGKYLSITSYKRDGTAVATPVWFVQQDGRPLVATDASSGKVKRIHHNPAVRVAVCTASGRLRGEQVSAVAEVLPESEVSDTERLIMHKYRIDLLIIKPLRFLQSALHLGRPRTKSVILAITPG